MVGRGARVHERLRHDGQARVDDVGLVDVEDKVGVLDEVDPEAEREAVGLPRVDHLRVQDPVLERLVVQEVEHVLDGQRERRASVGDAEDGLEQVVHVLLQRYLGGQQPSQVDLRHHLVGALVASVLPAHVRMVVVTHQMPHL